MAGSISTLTIRLNDDVSGPASKVTAALKAAEAQAKAIAAALKDSGASNRLGQALGKLGLGAADIQKVSAALKEYTRSAGLAADASKWTTAQKNQVKLWESATIASLRAVSREQAKGGQAALNARQPLGAPNKRRDALNTIGTTVTAAAAIKAENLASKGIRQGATLEHERVRMQASGMKPDDVARSEVEARKIAAETRLINVGEAMHMIRNIRSVVGSVDEALHMAEPLARLRATVQAAHPDKNVAEDFDQLIKGLEIKGVTQDMGKFNEYIEGMAKALNVFGDTLKPHEYYQMFKYSRQAGARLSSDFMLSIAPTLAQELGGSSAGTAFSGFNQAIIGGKIKDVAAAEFNRLGLLKPESVIKTKTGSVKGFKPGGMVGSDLAATDPYLYVQNVLKPALERKGLDTVEKQLDEVPRLFGNRVVAQFVGMMLTQADRIEKDRKLIKEAKGTEALPDFLKNDPLAGVKALSESTNTLLSTLTNPLMPAATAAMSGFSTALIDLTSVLAENKTAAGLVGVTAGVGALALAAKSIVSVKDLVTGGGASVALNGSAASLTGAAAALELAAAKLAGGSGLPDIDPRPNKNSPGKKGLGITGKIFKALPFIGTGIAAYEALDEIEQYSKKVNSGLPPSRAEVLTDGSTTTPVERQDAYRKEVEAGHGAAAILAGTQNNNRRANADTSIIKAQVQAEADAHDGAVDRARAKATTTGESIKTSLDIAANPSLDPTAFSTMKTEALDTGAKMKSALDITASPSIDATAFSATRASAVQIGAEIKSALDVKAAPSVDPTAFSAMKTMALDTGAEMKSALDITVKPQVDNSGLRETLSIIEQIRAGIGSINGTIGGLNSSVSGFRQRLNASFENHTGQE